MKLTRDRESEILEEMQGIFAAKIPEDHYEIIIRGELHYPLVEIENRWSTKAYLKKCLLTEGFLKDMLSLDQQVYAQDQLDKYYNKANALITTFVEKYCNKFGLLPQDIPIAIITEDEYNMTKKEEYHPITSPFEIFVTLNKKGQHFSVSV